MLRKNEQCFSTSIDGRLASIIILNIYVSSEDLFDDNVDKQQFVTEKFNESLQMRYEICKKKEESMNEKKVGFEFIAW
ncbi:TPA: hypothetical protein ACWWDF_003318 [Enterococcus faecium]|uniref:hypothetical protein n=1 Tax=Enterococcus faecium TaxID=1352 RepID=UPI001495EEE1|nr:hypothetical protein [Enterococcus faecium]